MSRRAKLMGSVALALALSGFALPAFTRNSLAQSAPDPTPAEQQGAYKPATSQGEPLPANSVAGEAGQNSSDTTSALAPAAEPALPLPAQTAAEAVKPARDGTEGPVVSYITRMPAAKPLPLPPASGPLFITVPPPEPVPAALGGDLIRPVTTPAQALQASAAPDAPSSPAMPAPSVLPPAAAPEESKPVAAPAETQAHEIASPAVIASLAGKLAALAAKPGSDGKAISDFYALRGNAPLWIVNGSVTKTAWNLLDRMSHADDDGLDASVFKVAGLDTIGAADADGQADAEIAVTSAVLTYIRHASSGRVSTKLIGKDIVPATNMPEPVAALASVAIASDPVAVLEGYNPVAPQYLALKRKLAEVRAANAATVQNTPPVVPAGPTLKVGMSDTRVALLRSRLGLTANDGDDSNIYDEALQKAVRDFQARRRIKANGALSPATVAALNGALRSPRANLESEIIANMERWRWMPHDMGVAHVFVNVPEFKVRVFRNGVVEHESRIVVGKPNTPTPIFSDTMSFVVMNPSWNVPQSIIRKEYLPKLSEDPDYLARHGFVVTYAGGQMQVRQPPGEGNALGHIKFMFPNNFSVYLHDTSSRSLFSREKRAFSHGCVRVDNPYKFAEIVMGADNGWTENRVRNMVGKREQRIDLAEKIPVHLAYFTAYVDEDGELRLLDDVYGYDRKVISALGLQG